MATYLYFSNDPSDLSGYLKLFVNTRSGNASSTLSTAVTNTTDVTTTTIAMTLTAGGSAAKWISEPLSVAVTVVGRPMGNIWAYESNASANAQVALSMAQYTGGALQSAFLVTSSGAELGTSATRVAWLSTNGATANTKEVITSTAFAVGDRIAITPVLGALGWMNAGYTVTFDYNLSTSNADGDSYVVLVEDMRLGTAQQGSGTTPGIKGKGVSYFYNIANVVQNAVNEGLIGANASAQEIIDEATNQQGLE